MDKLFEILREWPVAMQFLFLLVVVLVFSSCVVMISNKIFKFFNRALPVIIRGWPPNNDPTQDSDEPTDVEK